MEGAEGLWSPTTPRFLWLVKNLYDVQNQITGSIRFEKKCKTWMLSPLLFNEFGNEIMSEVEKRLPGRVGIVIRQSYGILGMQITRSCFSRNKEELNDMTEKLISH